MDALQYISSKSISAWDDGEESSLPQWAATLIWLGSWCRRTQLRDRRLIAFATLPTRELAASFVAFGAILGGACSFSDSLSWPRFRGLPIGSVVHWKEGHAGKNFSGTISAFQKLHDTEFIVLAVTRPASAAKKGLVFSISESQFDNFLFTEESPPTRARTSSFTRSQSLLKQILGDLNPKWIWADGAESLLVTRMKYFENAIAELALSCEDVSPVPMLDLLCAARSNEATLAKLRISHPRGKLDGKYPLAILEGAESFHQAEHLIGTTNILTILDRSEFSEGINDRLLELGAIANDVQLDELGELPTHFPPGIELAAYVVQGE